jgi:hypothetical protein
VTGAPALTLTCPRCGCDLPDEVFQPQGTPCSRCEAHVEGSAFPARFRVHQVSISEPVVAGEGACFFHSERKAAFVCSRCGRFLCALCRISWAGENVCTACLDRQKLDQAHALASSRFHFDSLALALSTLPILTWILSMLTAPLALGFTLFTWRRECSIVPRSKIRFVLAILFSVLIIAGWVVFWIYLARRNAHSAVPFDSRIL